MNRAADVTRPCHLLGLVVFACLVFGGCTVRGTAIDSVLQVLTILAATATIAEFRDQPVSALGIGVFTVVLCTGLAQIIPLPSGWLNGLRPAVFVPGSAFGSVSTVSLSISRTIPAVISVLCSVYLFIALTKLRQAQILVLAKYVVLALVVNVFIALAIYSGVEIAPLYDALGYPISAGSFENENHFSTFVLSTIPILFYLLREPRHRGTLVVLSVLALLALLAAGSRAGILIGLAVFAISLLLCRQNLRPGRVAVCGLAAIVAVYVYGATARIGGGEAEQVLQRQDFAVTTLRAIRDNWLLGTGYGSFDLVYPHYERLQDVYSAYVNHAHNDYLEIILEGGVTGVMIVIGYVLILLRRLGTLRQKSLQQKSLQQLAFLSICVILLHSTVDYPLRTTAIASLFAFANALLFLRPVTPPIEGAPGSSAGTRTAIYEPPQRSASLIAIERK